MPSKLVYPFVICDFETSGLKSIKNAITEVAMIAIRGDTLEEICRHEAYMEYAYSTSLEYDQKALDITGIKIEDLVELGLKPKEFMDKMLEVFKAANETASGKFSKTIIVGHNITFDIDFLNALAKLTKTDLSKYLLGRTTHDGFFEPIYIDTCNLARMKWQDDEQMENFKLDTSIEKAGFELADAHRAMNDVIGNKELFISFINDFRFGTGEGEIKTANRKIRHRNHFQF